MQASATRANAFGIPAFILGVLALALVLLQFHTGSFSHPSTGKVRAEKDLKIMGAVMGKVQIREPGFVEQKKFDIDSAAALSTTCAGFLAIVLAAIAYVRREDKRILGSAVAMGGAALALQLLVLAIWFIVGAIVLYVLFSNFVELS